MVKEQEGLFRILLDIFCFSFCLFLICPSWGFWSQAWKAWRMTSGISTLTNIFFLSKKKSKGLNISKSKGKSMQLRIFSNTEDFFKIHRSLFPLYVVSNFILQEEYTYIFLSIYSFLKFIYLYTNYIYNIYVYSIYVSPQEDSNQITH